MKSDKDKKKEMDEEIEIEHLQFAYNKGLEIFKLNNDNYFKRVQIVMVALQAGLFITFLKLLQFNSNLFMKFILQIIIIVLGGIIAFVWSKLMDKQMQYLELQKRYLRNLEWRFVELNVPIDYFNVEGAIVTEVPKDKFNTSTVNIKEECDKYNKPNKFAEFKWSKDRYPDERGSQHKIHRVGEVTGRIVQTEKWLARGAIFIWPIILFFLIVCQMIPCLFSKLKVILCN